MNGLWVDLPNLKSINLGALALGGKDNTSLCSLIMIGDSEWILWWIDLPKLESLVSESFSFVFAHIVALSSIDWSLDWWIDVPNLKTVKLPGAFLQVTIKSINSSCVNLQ